MDSGISHYLQDPTFWVAFVTVVFAVVVYKPIKNALGSMLDERIENIRKELEEASQLKDEANALLADAERKLAKSEEDAKEIISHAKKEAENIITNVKEKSSRDIDNRKKLAMQKIQAAEDAAFEDIKKDISNIVTLSAQTILEENIDEEGSKSLINDSLDKISKTIH